MPHQTIHPKPQRTCPEARQLVRSIALSVIHLATKGVKPVTTADLEMAVHLSQEIGKKVERKVDPDRTDYDMAQALFNRYLDPREA
jgi:hypothetical protein